LNVLGLNAFHADASACLLRDGQLVAAAEEERFRRVKHWAGFPAEAIRWCLAEAGIGLSGVDHVAINQDARANLRGRLAFMLRQPPSPSFLLQRLQLKARRRSVATLLAAEFRQPFRGETHAVEHHLSHLASAFLVSPFREAAAVSVDGFGDFASAAWGIGRGATLSLSDKVYFPHSLGIFYQALTQFLGFPTYGDEYKVMGLAAYGQPRYLPQMRRVVELRPGGRFTLDLDYFRHARERIEHSSGDGAPEFGRIYAPALESLLGPARAAGDAIEQRHHDLASSVQAMYEEAFFHLLGHVHSQTRVPALCLAGGCAMNSVANGKIYRRSPFRELYVQAGAGDAGGAIGAALAVWNRLQGERSFVMNHAYWGPRHTDEEIEAVLQANAGRVQAAGCELERAADDEELCKRIARSIASGAVAGWFQGRMEWGPRALGNRSILGDPRRADMKDLLNRKIKRRESFRPFAPSVLREEMADWFEADDDVPFMLQVYPIRADKRERIPAVTHVDGSGRLQTVSRAANPLYHRLIERFFELTGVPMLLNTSFNENEPVVCRPQEALECFLRTGMDVLAMGRWIVSRRTGNAAQ
jgi:carbamoyltransferase